MTTILLLGKTGQVGHELLQTLAPLGTLLAPGHSELDLANADSIRGPILQARPDVIVNAVGFTNVDAAQAQPELAMQLNATAPGIIAAVAKSAGIGYRIGAVGRELGRIHAGSTSRRRPVMPTPCNISLPTRHIESSLT